MKSLDPSQKDQLTDLIETMLKDNSTLVLGSVISSMCQVCPDRLDLIHKHYRKLCRLLVDADEWGQIEILGLLLRYAKGQFLDPNIGEKTAVVDQPRLPSKSHKDFYSEEDSGASGSSCSPNRLDPDHALLLRACGPLLFSRNPSVVLTVVKLYFHLTPADDCFRPAKALIRLLGLPREERHIVLLNIVTMAQQRPELFRSHIRHFFLFEGEPSFIRDLKLEILGLLATEANVGAIMREFKDYVRSPDKAMVVTTIQVVDEAMSVLMALVSARDENVVAEAVVVTRRLLQLTPENNTRTIVHLSKSLDEITIAMARASILWLIGQYCETIPKIVPDTLRKAAKLFSNESAIVKLQILNLGAKLVCTDASEINVLLFGYVLNLAKFDLDYDIRDRGRFLRALVYDPLVRAGAQGAEGRSNRLLKTNLKQILLSARPPPMPENPYAGRERYTLATISHCLNQSAEGYENLPDWPLVKPDGSARNVEEFEERWNRDRVISSPVKELKFQPKKPKKRVIDLNEFYNSSESEDSEEENSDDQDDEEDDEGDEEGDDEEDTDEEEEDTEQEEGATDEAGDSEEELTSLQKNDQAQGLRMVNAEGTQP
ncbi:AP-3 complex subunit beta-2 [Borealophlyctis nickersoniae]|nr:AP-3 complex subunit beta-2 [Borealophlyctis nickersoniae]